MPSIKLENFGGIAPRTATHLLPGAYATIASDVDLENGLLCPLYHPGPAHASTPAGAPIVSMFKTQRGQWLLFSRDTDVVESAPSLQGNLLYRSDANGVYVADEAGASVGVWFSLGVPRPPAPLFVSAPIPVESRSLEARAYFYTYVTAFGEEGAPSPVSATVQVNDGAAVTVVGFAPPSAGRNVTAIRLYRITTGADQEARVAQNELNTAGLLVAELSTATSTYTDGTLNIDLGLASYTADYDVPPQGLTGIVELGDGVLAGFVGSQVYFSESYQPHAWPRRHMLQLEDAVVALAEGGEGLYILTTGFPYFVAHGPADKREPLRYPEPLPCVSKRSVAVYSTTVYYASRDGLVQLRRNQHAFVSTTHYTPKQWRDTVNPTEIVGVAHEGRYYGWSPTYGFIYTLNHGAVVHPEAAKLTTFTLRPSAGHMGRDGVFYVAMRDGTVREWNAGEQPLTAIWRGRLEIAPGHTSFAAAQVVASPALQVTQLRIFGDDRLRFERYVRDHKPFRLPLFGRATDWQLEIETQSCVREVHVATSMHELIEEKSSAR